MSGRSFECPVEVPLGVKLEGVSDREVGLIMGDFVSRRFLGHEGRGAGKSTTRGGRVTRKRILRQKLAKKKS